MCVDACTLRGSVETCVSATMIFLGDTVRDTVTGYEGVATCRQEHIGGRVSWCIERGHCDTGLPEEVWFEEARLEIGEHTPGAIGFQATPTPTTAKPLELPGA